MYGEPTKNSLWDLSPFSELSSPIPTTLWSHRCRCILSDINMSSCLKPCRSLGEYAQFTNAIPGACIPSAAKEFCTSLLHANFKGMCRVWWKIRNILMLLRSNHVRCSCSATCRSLRVRVNVVGLCRLTNQSNKTGQGLYGLSPLISLTQDCKATCPFHPWPGTKLIFLLISCSR